MTSAPSATTASRLDPHSITRCWPSTRESAATAMTRPLRPPIRIDRMTSATSAAHAPGAELLDYDDVIARYDPILAVEVHADMSTATKMFCGCANEFGPEPNTQVCPVCLGLPGSLPVLNEAAVESAIRLGVGRH